MSTPNARVAVMITSSNGSSGSPHGDTAENLSTNSIISCVRGNRSSCHSYLMNNESYNRIISHDNPGYGVSTAGEGKPKTFYVRKNQ